MPVFLDFAGFARLAETLHVVFSMNFLYEYLIHDFGHPERFINVYWYVLAFMRSATHELMCPHCRSVNVSLLKLHTFASAAY